MLRIAFPRLEAAKALIQLLQKIIELAPHTHYFAGNPENNVTGNVGDICINTTGGAGSTLYVKESGDGTNKGWAAK